VCYAELEKDTYLQPPIVILRGTVIPFNGCQERHWVRVGIRRWLSVFLLVFVPSWLLAAGLAVPQIEKLLRTGQELAERTHYLEALDLLEEARDALDATGMAQSGLYGDVLYAQAEVKIKGRLHQSFPAQYVKTALKDVQTANKLRGRLPDILPRKLAEGYFVEGYIQKRFFKRNGEARTCFEKALSADAGFASAKRELGELVLENGQK
jgi:hypothetical protein